MNGELHHASRMTAAVKYTLAGEAFAYERFPYEQEPRFLFQDGRAAVGGGLGWNSSGPAVCGRCCTR